MYDFKLGIACCELQVLGRHTSGLSYPLANTSYSLLVQYTHSVDDVCGLSHAVLGKGIWITLPSIHLTVHKVKLA